MKNAVVSIEDARYYEHNGVDFQGIGRALVKDILSLSAAQGASTITEQFVKKRSRPKATARSCKFREAALAYRLERHWSKDKILTEYLNTIYFGEGAYGIEAAARTYFGEAHPGCGTGGALRSACSSPGRRRCWPGSSLPDSAYDPKVYPENAPSRRNVVLEKMYEQGNISQEQLDGRACSRRCPRRASDLASSRSNAKRAHLHRLPAPAANRKIRLRRRPSSAGSKSSRRSI